ncbi:hypothetical protein B4168_0940 [Anoxybacillus flavithermus]|nr:hypothetical protein B4168_0940 [Anoxybacillus flavithermus]OAO86947.1 hypothetical protein GT23_1965 [Parageobacillus thermoglucosidasius]
MTIFLFFTKRIKHLQEGTVFHYNTSNNERIKEQRLQTRKCELTKKSYSI